MKSTMLKGLMLMFDNQRTWDSIAVSPPRWSIVLFAHLIPILLMASILEGYGLMEWGKSRGQIEQVREFHLKETLSFETVQLVLTIALVIISTKLIQTLGETFHGRQTFTQVFSLVAYSLSPLIILRCFNAIPPLSPWIPWGVGIALSLATLYHGLPRIMQPNPSHAFGLFITSCTMLVMIFGFLRFLTAWYLAGKFVNLERLLSKS